MASHQQKSTTAEEYRDHTSTPLWLWAAYDALFDFSIDLAATSKSAKSPRYFTIEDDALSKSWANSVDPFMPLTGWLNPPYSNVLPWVQQALAEQQAGFTTVMFIFNDSSVEWWPEGQPCIIQEITGYYYDHTYKTSRPGRPKGTIGKKWASGRINFINAATGEEMRDPLNKPMCAIIFPALYSGPTMRQPITKLALMERGHAHLEQLAKQSTKLTDQVA